MTSLLQAAKSHPWTATGIVALLLALPHLHNGLQLAARHFASQDTADAAMQQAEQTRQEFQEYLQEQREYRAALDGYNKAVTELMQQRTQAADTAFLEHDADGCWRCEAPDVETCWSEGRWRRCAGDR